MFAHRLISCRNLAGLYSGKTLLLREDSSPSARKLNGRWKQEARRGRQNGKTTDDVRLESGKRTLFEAHCDKMRGMRVD